MSIFSDNIRYMRNQLRLSQQKVADELLITRGRYAKYEDAASEPPIDILLKISRYFRVSIDLLVTVDIRKYPLESIIKLPDNRIVLPVTMNRMGENTIEIIPHRASMGYLQGYSDPGYFEGLQTISLPFLRNGKYRAFPAEGDSMPPYADGTYIVGKFIENSEFMKPGRSYVFITRSEGITFKRFSGKTENGLIVAADNAYYQPYEILLTDLFEIWEFACSINMEELSTENGVHSIKSLFDDLKNEIKTLATAKASTLKNPKT